MPLHKWEETGFKMTNPENFQTLVETTWIKDKNIGLEIILAQKNLNPKKVYASI